MGLFGFGKKKDFNKGMEAGAKPFEQKFNDLGEQVTSNNEDTQKAVADLKSSLDASTENLNQAAANAKAQDQNIQNINAAVQGQGQTVDAMLDSLSKKERYDLYQLNNDYDVSTLDADERRHLVGLLYTFSAEFEINELQQKYLRHLQAYLNVTEPQIGVRMDSIGNIDSLTTQKIYCKVLLEFAYLNDPDKVNLTAFDEFSVSGSVRKQLIVGIQNIVKTVGPEGLIEKYGLKDIDEVKAAQLAQAQAHAKIEAERQQLSAEKAAYQAEKEQVDAEQAAKTKALETAQAKKAAVERQQKELTEIIITHAEKLASSLKPEENKLRYSLNYSINNHVSRQILTNLAKPSLERDYLDHGNDYLIPNNSIEIPATFANKSLVFALALSISIELYFLLFSDGTIFVYQQKPTVGKEQFIGNFKQVWSDPDFDFTCYLKNTNDNPLFALHMEDQNTHSNVSNQVEYEQFIFNLDQLDSIEVVSQKYDEQIIRVQLKNGTVFALISGLGYYITHGVFKKEYEFVGRMPLVIEFLNNVKNDYSKIK